MKMAFVASNYNFQSKLRSERVTGLKNGIGKTLGLLSFEISSDKINNTL